MLSSKPLLSDVLIPDPTGNDFPPPWQLLDQGSVLAVHCTKTARKRCDVQHNQKLSQIVLVYKVVYNQKNLNPI